MKKAVRFGLIWVACLAAAAVQAQGFSAVVSPPRIETFVKPGQTTRQILEITQVGPAPGRFKVYTNDWTLNAGGGVDFSEDLLPGSCRPWVALEKREVVVQGNAKARFRIEITPPADAPVTQCRFAILVEGLDTSNAASGSLSFPVSGRIGVIVYASMTGTEPELSIVSQSIGADTSKLPTLQVRNTGAAHGRVEGMLSGLDAKGTKLDFTPSTLPILPGETRAITLAASTQAGVAVPVLSYPVSIKGNLEWNGKRVPFEHVFKD